MSGTITDLTFDGSTATYTVPTTGEYYIVVYGAQGGNSTILPSTSTSEAGPPPTPGGGTGGKGAEIGGEFSLTAGEVLQVAVGGVGASGNAGGGGGGSFVVGPGNTPLVIAGGGGGGGWNNAASNINGGVGLTGSNGGNAGSGMAAGGVGGNGGGGLDGGGGGGGFLSGGQSGLPPDLLGPGGGAAFPSLTGGLGDFGGGNGGFGGGGGAGGLGSGTGAGGGGGYSGGGGAVAGSADGGGGGGGGSIDTGIQPLLAAGENSGNGSVFIAPVDTPIIGGTVADQPMTVTTPIDPFTEATVTDPNLGTLPETLTVTPSSTANGMLSDPNVATDLSSISDGVYTVSGTAAQVEADLRDLMFAPAADTIGETTVFTISVTNVADLTATDNISSVFDVPGAVSRTWIGGGDSRANNPADWNPTGAPVPGDKLTMPGGTMNIQGNDLAGNALSVGVLGDSGSPLVSSTLNLSNNAELTLQAIRAPFTATQTTVNVTGYDTLNADLSGDVGTLLGSQPSTLTIDVAPFSALNATFNASFQSAVSISASDESLLVNNQVSILDGASAVINADVVGAGSFAVTAFPLPRFGPIGGSLEFGGAVSYGETVTLSGGSTPDRTSLSTLEIDQPHEFLGAVTMQTLSEIDLVGLANADSYSFQNDMLSIYAGNRVIDMLRLSNDGAELSVWKNANDVFLLQGSSAPPSGSLALPEQSAETSWHGSLPLLCHI